MGHAEGEHLRSGNAGHRGRLGFAAPLARGRTGAAACRQVRDPDQVRTGNPPLRPHELASARAANGHEHQGEAARRG